MQLFSALEGSNRDTPLKDLSVGRDTGQGLISGTFPGRSGRLATMGVGDAWGRGLATFTTFLSRAFDMIECKGRSSIGFSPSYACYSCTLIFGGHLMAGIIIGDLKLNCQSKLKQPPNLKRCMLSLLYNQGHPTVTERKSE